MSELKNKTVKGIIWSGAFSVLQQGLGLFFSVLIARLLSPSDYGIVAMLTIFTSIATLLQESGFIMVLTNKKDVTHKEYCTVFWLNIVISFFVYIILFLLAPLIACFYDKTELLSLSRYVFLGFFISSFGIVQNAYLFKHLKVKEKGITSLIALLVSGIVGIIMALNGYCYWGLATQGILGTLIGTISVWFYSPFRPTFCFDYTFLKNTINDGIRFTIPNFISAISGNIYSVLLGKFYSPSDLGLYSQGNKFNIYAYSFILGILRNVSQPVLVQVKENKDQFLIIFRKLFRFTLYISIPIMFGLSFVASELISILLTDEWTFVADIMQILCIGGFFIIMNTLCTYALISMNKTRLYMWLGIGNSTINLFVAVIASVWGITSLAIATVSVQILSFLVTYIIINKTCKYTFNLFRKDFFPVLFIACLSLIITYFFTIGLDNIYIIFILKIILAIGLYIILSSYFHLDTFEEIKSMLLQKTKKNKHLL